MREQEAYNRLVDNGIKPSIQRLAIMEFLLAHLTHPTVEDVYSGLRDELPTLSRTTVYNTLRLFAECNSAQMITIDDHHVCYDGDITPHVHFLCKKCGRVVDMFDEDAPMLKETKMIDDNMVDEVKLYYKGVCRHCLEEGE